MIAAGLVRGTDAMARVMTGFVVGRTAPYLASCAA